MPFCCCSLLRCFLAFLRCFSGGFSACVGPTAKSSRTRFSIKFYYVAILFVIIDVEAIFLYTWAVEFVRLGSLGLAEMLTFMTLLVLAYAYAWKKGAFEWVK